jgi:hypothetical protein
VANSVEAVAGGAAGSDGDAGSDDDAALEELGLDVLHHAAMHGLEYVANRRVALRAQRAQRARSRPRLRRGAMASAGTVPDTSPRRVASAGAQSAVGGGAQLSSMPPRAARSATPCAPIALSSDTLDWAALSHLLGFDDTGRVATAAHASDTAPNERADGYLHSRADHA